MEKNTKNPEFYDFIQKSKNINYLVGYYSGRLIAIRKYDYLDAQDRNIEPGDEIKEYDPANIFSATKIAEIEYDLSY